MSDGDIVAVLILIALWGAVVFMIGVAIGRLITRRRR